MYNSGSYELRPLDVMYHLGSWMIWMILYHELKALDSMNYSRLWKTWTTRSHHLRALDAMKNSRLWMTWPTQRFIYYEQLKVVVDKKYYGSWAQGSRKYEQLKVMNYINNLGSRELRLIVLWIALGCGWFERFCVMSSSHYMLWTTQGHGRYEWI